MASALAMEGGRSSRMRLGTAAAHKAIVPILGVPLLERNLNALIARAPERRTRSRQIVKCAGADQSGLRLTLTSNAKFVKQRVVTGDRYSIYSCG
jgi:hypothetical protein